MFPDDVIEPTVAIREMIRVRKVHSDSVLLAAEVEPLQVSNYSVFDVAATDDDRVKKVVDMVGKPAVEDATLNLVVTGRYLLDRAFWSPPPYHSWPGRGAAAYRRHRSPHLRGTPRSCRSP